MNANVRIIRANGEEEEHLLRKGNRLIADIEKQLGCSCLDTVNLRDGRVMLVDDSGMAKRLQPNPKATALYLGICRPGTTLPIRGDVAIALDEDFA